MGTDATDRQAADREYFDYGPHQMNNNLINPYLV